MLPKTDVWAKSQIVSSITKQLTTALLKAKNDEQIDVEVFELLQEAHRRASALSATLDDLRLLIE